MPSVRPETTQLTGAVTSIPKPSTAAPTDLLLAFVTNESSTFGVTLTGGTPEWQPLASKSTVNGSGESTKGIISSGIWWKPAGVGETSWTLEAPSQYLAVAVIAVTDAQVDAPLFTVSADQTASTVFTTVTSPAGPPPGIGDLELRWVAGDDYTSTSERSWTAPGSTTEVCDLTDRYVAAQLTRQSLTSATTSARSHTVGAAGLFAAHGFTLRIPAPGSGRVVPMSAAVHRAATW
ncbi:hypothetical protein ABT158_03690 [Nonomuraea sp. NPDC001636]|uniref:hypothetical protein n=1 Tax=Nonomuraea sp. NPDC001636 TaxID=3154391 RepID=UPI00331D2DCA